VTAAHQRGLKVWVYTIDDPADMNRLLDLGIDGLITNNPGRAWRVMAERRSGRSSP
jgi:glycerophosphoryl diester phosphodiesterase